MAEEWRTWTKRQRIIHQIDEYMRQTPEAAQKTAQELENSVFQKATKEEEYLQYVNRIIKYLKDQAQNTNQNNSNLNAMLGGQGNAPRTANMGQGVTSGGQMVHSNPGQMGNQPQMVHTGNTVTQMAHGSTSGGQMSHGGVSDNQSVGPGGIMQGSLVQGPNRMPHLMPGNMVNQGDMVNWQSQAKQRRANDMILINVNAKQPNMGTINQINAQASKMGSLPMSIANQSDGSQVNQISVGGQIARQGMTMQPRVPSPSFAGGGSVPHQRQGTPTPTGASPASQQQQQHNVSYSSLTFISPSPSSNAVPSPAGNTAGARGMNQLGAPSPSGMINTPGQPQQQQPSPAPVGGSMEDRAYMEKAKQLQSRYLEPLREFVQKLDNDDSGNARKIRNLIEVFENPQRRPHKGLEILKACETALERLGIADGSGGVCGAPVSKPATKENPITVLFEAINFAHQSPLGHHTIHRTVSPALKTLLGPDFDAHLPKRMKVEDNLVHSTENPPITDIVQGEVARLPPRFKVNLDCQQLSGSDDLTLSCQLDDPNLPCVPPITIIIPPSYPNSPPRCRLSMIEYDTTSFLKKVREIMINRQFHLPEVCSLTMILDAWEMSVRRACSSKPFVPDAIDPLINLNIFS